MVVLIISTILAVSVASYLSLVQHQNRMSVRSQCWNLAIAIVEAGIEEGLQHLNENEENLQSNGWAKSGNLYSRDETLSDGSRYTTIIDMTSSRNPSVTARADVSMPGLFQPMAAAIGVTQSDSASVSRAVRVRCSKNALFTAALVSRHAIDLKGNGVYTDSFDSSDPAKSANCRYDKNKFSGDRGDIASIGGIIDSVSIQNANIYGKVHTAPNQPVSIGSNGGIGPHGSQAGTIAEAEAKGLLLRDANFTFPDTALPSTAGLMSPSSGTVVVPTYTFSTNATTSFTCPDPLPAGGVATNSSFITVSAPPNPPPPGLKAETTTITSSTIPDPNAEGILTNILTTPTTASAFPAAGTYLGGVSTNWSKNGKKIDSYTYQKITGRSYTYSLTTYTYPASSYTYDDVATSVTYTTNFYDNIVEADTAYYSAGLSGKTLIKGPNTRLVLPNGLTGSEDFTIAQGAGVLIHAGGTDVTLHGNQVLNPNGFAGSFIVYCAPTVTSVTFSGNGQFTGVLVAPEADLKLNGGGNATEDFCGSLMVNNVRLNGHFSFHWDESLENLHDSGRFLISTWDEIDPKGVPAP